MYFVGHHVYPEISYIKILVILKLGSNVVKLVKNSDNVNKNNFLVNSVLLRALSRTGI